MSEDSSKQPSETKKAGSLLPAILALLTTVLLFFVTQAIGAVSLGIVPLLHHWSQTQANNWINNSVAAQFVYVLIADGLLIAGVFFALKAFRWSLRDIGLRRPRLGNIMAGIAIVIPYYVVYYAIIRLLMLVIPSFNVGQQQQIGFTSVHGGLALVLTFVSLVVIPPLAEEIAMRGFLYTGLRKWLPRILAGLAVSAVFGAAHLAEGGASGPLWVGAIDTFTLSLFLVYLREKTGNLWAGIVLHAMKNGLAFFVLFIIGGR